MDDPGAPTLLIVDDSQLDLRQWGKMFEQLGYQVVTLQAGDDFSSTELLTEKMRELAPDLILTDFDMMGMNGFHVLSAGKQAAPSAPVVLHSANPAQVSQFSGISVKALTSPGFFLAVLEKGQVKEIDEAFKNHLHSTHRSTP